MPSKEAHIVAARRNESTAQYLLSDGDNHLAWVAAVVFYEALHIVEAMLEADPDSGVNHTDDHKTRNRLLKTTPRYAHIWKMYRPLWDASLVARYLRENDNHPTYDIFDRYLDKNGVTSLLLGHYLAQIKKSAAKFLGNDFMNVASAS